MQEKTDALKPKDFPYTFYLMDAAQEKGHGLPRKEHEPARQSRSTKEPACVSSFPSLEDLLC